MKGLLAKKLGMAQLFNADGTISAVTVLEAGPCRVLGLRTKEKDGYSAARIAFEPVKEEKANEPRKGEFKKANLDPHRHIVEIRNYDGLEQGQELKAEIFAAGELVDVTSTSKGKGLQGRAHVGPDGQRAHDFARLQGRASRRGEKPPAGPGRCARREGRPGPGQAVDQESQAQRPRRQAQPEEGLDGRPGPVLRRAGRAQRRGRPPGGDLQREAQHAGHAPGLPAPARQRETGHGEHEDPRRGIRRRRQAVPPEGHRPRPPRLDARAQHEGRRQRLRTEAPRLLAPHAEADAPPRAAQRAQPEGHRRPGQRHRELCLRRTQDEPGRRADGSDRLRQHGAGGAARAQLHGQPLLRKPRGRQDRACKKPEHPRPFHAHLPAALEGHARAPRGELQPAPQRGCGMTTRAASEIVIGPVITERTYLLYTQGRYTFKVLARASKTEIKKALEEQYESQNIKVRDINTVTMRGKKRRSFRRVGSGTVGSTSDWKKAIVTLGAGQKIEGLFGSV